MLLQLLYGKYSKKYSGKSSNRGSLPVDWKSNLSKTTLHYRLYTEIMAHFFCYWALKSGPPGLFGIVSEGKIFNTTNAKYYFVQSKSLKVCKNLKTDEKWGMGGQCGTKTFRRGCQPIGLQ